MNDLISRQAAINAADRADYAGLAVEDVKKVTDEVVKELKQVPSINQWIPCSERLPDYMTAVLTWDGMVYAVEKRIPYITDEDGEHIMSEWWVSDDFDEENTEYYPNLRDGAAIAWMPLPEPWKG